MIVYMLSSQNYEDVKVAGIFKTKIGAEIVKKHWEKEYCAYLEIHEYKLDTVLVNGGNDYAWPGYSTLTAEHSMSIKDFLSMAYKKI